MSELTPAAKPSPSTPSMKGSPVTMDFSLITNAAAALAAAKDFGKAALGVRDFNQMAAVVSQLNDQILKAQESLFAHNAQLLALQQDQFETREKLRKAEETIAERGRYALTALSTGVFVYRVYFSPEELAFPNPYVAEPAHYICQPCFDSGVKAVLQRLQRTGGLRCPKCAVVYPTDESIRLQEEQRRRLAAGGAALDYPDLGPI